MRENRNHRTEDGLVIRCNYDALLSPQDIKPHPKNPNVHPAKQLELFAKVLSYTGCRRPVTISTRSGFATRGHGLFEAAFHRGYKQVPVEYQDYDSEEQELADLLADNALHELSFLDADKKKSILAELNASEGDFDMEYVGIQMDTIEKTLKEFAPEGGPPLEMTSALPQERPPRNDDEPSAPPAADPEPEKPSNPVAQTKMVQLFLTTLTFVEFERIVQAFQQRMGTTNVTDTVMGILRNAEKALSNPSGETTSEGPVADAPGQEVRAE